MSSTKINHQCSEFAQFEETIYTRILQTCALGEPTPSPQLGDDVLVHYVIQKLSSLNSDSANISESLGEVLVSTLSLGAPRTLRMDSKIAKSLLGRALSSLNEGSISQFEVTITPDLHLNQSKCNVPVYNDKNLGVYHEVKPREPEDLRILETVETSDLVYDTLNDNPDPISPFTLQINGEFVLSEETVITPKPGLLDATHELGIPKANDINPTTPKHDFGPLDIDTLLDEHEIRDIEHRFETEEQRESRITRERRIERETEQAQCPSLSSFFALFPGSFTMPPLPSDDSTLFTGPFLPAFGERILLTMHVLLVSSRKNIDEYGHIKKDAIRPPEGPLRPNYGANVTFAVNVYCAGEADALPRVPLPSLAQYGYKQALNGYEGDKECWDDDVVANIISQTYSRSFTSPESLKKYATTITQMFSLKAPLRKLLLTNIPQELMKRKNHTPSQSLMELNLDDFRTYQLHQSPEHNKNECVILNKSTKQYEHVEEKGSLSDKQENSSKSKTCIPTTLPESETSMTSIASISLSKQPASFFYLPQILPCDNIVNKGFPSWVISPSLDISSPLLSSEYFYTNSHQGILGDSPWGLLPFPPGLEEALLHMGEGEIARFWLHPLSEGYGATTLEDNNNKSESNGVNSNDIAMSPRTNDGSTAVYYDNNNNSKNGASEETSKTKLSDENSEKTKDPIEYLRRYFCLPSGMTLVVEVHLLCFQKGLERWEMIPSQRIAMMEAWKTRANVCFRGVSVASILRAERLYERALKVFYFEKHLSPHDQQTVNILRVMCFSNMAACCTKRGDEASCLRATEEALRLDPFHIKSAYRKAQALYKRADLKEAIALLESVTSHHMNEEQDENKKKIEEQNSKKQELEVCLDDKNFEKNEDVQKKCTIHLSNTPINVLTPLIKLLALARKKLQKARQDEAIFYRYAFRKNNEV